MRKRGGNEDGVVRREREESMHRKAAALAWFKHGRKGSSILGSGRGGNLSKLQNPILLHAPARARGQQAYINAASSFNGGANEGVSGASEYKESNIASMGMGAILVPPNYIETPHHNLSYMHQATLSPMHQASRFRAEALALQNSSPPPPPTATTITTTSSNKQQMINMSTGQSLALLSLLPHHQSQNCFTLSKKEHAGSSSNNNNINNTASPWDCGSSLYDSFELLCLSNQLGRCLTTVNAASSSSSSGSGSGSSSYSKLMKNMAANPLHAPSLQPSYIPRSLYSLPQFMIPNYLVSKSSKKRSSLIHPVFSIPNATNSTPPPSLPAPPASSPPLHSQISEKSQPVAEDHATRKKSESGGFRRVFNSLLKSLHMKEGTAQQKPKRSNLSEELEKLPKNRPPSSRGALKYEDPASAMALNRSPKSYSSSASAEMASKRSPSSSSSAAAMESRRSLSSSSSSSASAASMASRGAPTAAASYQYHYHFRNEGFRTTSKPPKSVKWVQPGAS